MKNSKKPSHYLIHNNQPKPYYDYDGLTGVWLWIPWWIYAVLAILVWPFSIYILPHLYIRYAFININFNQYQQETTWILLGFMLLSMILSALKTWRIKHRLLNYPKKQEFLTDIAKNKISKQKQSTKTPASIERIVDVSTANEQHKILKNSEKTKTTRKIKPKINLNDEAILMEDKVKKTDVDKDGNPIKKTRKPRKNTQSHLQNEDQIKSAGEVAKIRTPRKRTTTKKVASTQLDLEI